MTYSELAIASVVLVIALDLLVIRTRLLGTLRFWFSYAIVFSFQLLTNSWLTGNNIVMYERSSYGGFASRTLPSRISFLASRSSWGRSSFGECSPGGTRGAGAQTKKKATEPPASDNASARFPESLLTLGKRGRRSSSLRFSND